MTVDNKSRTKKRTYAAGVFVAGFILLIQPHILLAQSNSSSNEALDRAIEECQKAPDVPFKSVAEIQNEVACTAAALEMLTNNDAPLESPVVQMTSRSGEWDYQYILDGAFAVTPACNVKGPLVLPSARPVRIRLSSDDTIHEFQIPSLGLSATALPGRIEELTVESNSVSEIEGIAITDSGSANSKRTLITLRFAAEMDYKKWERDALRAKGCGKK